MVSMKKIFYTFLLNISFYPAYSQIDTIMSSSVQELLKVKPKNTLISLLNTEVVTASNSAEKLGDTPASIMVVTAEQIQKRGYRNMLEVMQDLPQIDLALSYGDELMKTYFRGYRTDLGSPFLVMIDGIIYNNLYFNQVNIWGLFRYPMWIE
jgi:outer membrane receptor for ferrienterochelin and colicin